MSHNYESLSENGQSPADPSGGLSKIGFYCLISCRAKIGSEYVTIITSLLGQSLLKSNGKAKLSQISPFKVDDVFSLFHNPLCHSTNEKINRKPKILLQFLPSGTVLYTNHVVMTSL